MHHSEMQVGQIYNVVYTGPNEAYARINGKETVVVIATSPHLQLAQLFPYFGDAFADDLRGHPVTYERPDITFAERVITPAPNEEDWLRHSMRVDSLEDGIAKGVLTAERISSILNVDHFAVTRTDHAGKVRGVVGRFLVEDETSFPLLQIVYVVWPDWQAMTDALARYGVEKT